MIYLWLNILGYLLAASLLGGGAGWLLRNVSASRKEEELRVRLADASMRAQQLERRSRAEAARRTNGAEDATRGEAASVAHAGVTNATQPQQVAEEPAMEQSQLRRDGGEITWEHQALMDELERERRRVSELERERELQDRSLRLLHQQLELERERRLALAS